MDTPAIDLYYKEHDPLKRKKLLFQAIEEGEEPEENRIREELWEIRYQDPAERGSEERADGYMSLWMIMEYNRESANHFFGWKSARKEVEKQLKKLKFKEFREKGPLYEEMLYRECCHLVKIYMELCEKDRSYGSMLGGIMNMSEENLKKKLQEDVYQTAALLPSAIKMEEELGIITKAAKEMYELHFPGEIFKI